MSYTPYQGICLYTTNALATWTGTTGDTSLKTFTLKGGTVDVNDRLEFILLYDVSGGQTNSIKMGSTTILSLNTAASISVIRKGNVHFRNSVSSQVMMAAASQTDLQSSATALLTSAEDFASDVIFDIRSNLTNIASTFSVRTFSLILWKAPIAS